MTDSPDLTELLASFSQGDSNALPSITPVILAELQRLAKREFGKERQGHTLQTTALVNEAYMKLVQIDIPWADRGHFYAVAARQMRFILVDHARSKVADKRGGGAAHIDIDDALVVSGDNLEDIIYLDQLFNQLSDFDERAARLMELRLFSGLNNNEIAELESLSLATVERDLRAAKAWMKHQLTDHHE